MFLDKLRTAGEHQFVFSGAKGLLEGVLSVPAQINSDYIALLGHPDSREGGSMNNKVVTTVASAFKELQIPSLRFNFRGVGKSSGEFDGGLGESEDMLALKQICQIAAPSLNFLFAGFSFGSYVAYRAAAQSETALLLTIAPPVHHYNYAQFTPIPRPWVILQGENDDVVPYSVVADFAFRCKPKLEIKCFKDTGHFFHGKLRELKDVILECVSSNVF